MKVLLGLGAGDDSMYVLERTVLRTTAAGDELTVAIGGSGPLESVDALESRVREELDEFDVDAAVRTVEDDMGSSLVALAEREGFDQIVLEGGDRSPMGKIRLSNTAEFVLLNARTSVTLVR